MSEKFAVIAVTIAVIITAIVLDYKGSKRLNHLVKKEQEKKHD